MSSEINNSANNSLQTSKKEQLEELRAKYEASKDVLKKNKAIKNKYSNIYAAAKEQYASTDPTKVTKARYQFDSASSSYRSADMDNDWLNISLFDAILDYGRMGFKW